MLSYGRINEQRRYFRALREGGRGKMKVGFHKGKKYYFNQFWMEIYEELKNGRLRKKRDFHKWEALIRWTPEHNILASKRINEMNGFVEDVCHSSFLKR